MRGTEEYQNGGDRLRTAPARSQQCERNRLGKTLSSEERARVGGLFRDTEHKTTNR